MATVRRAEADRAAAQASPAQILLREERGPRDKVLQADREIQSVLRYTAAAAAAARAALVALAMPDQMGLAAMAEWGKRLTLPAQTLAEAAVVDQQVI